MKAKSAPASQSASPRSATPSRRVRRSWREKLADDKNLPRVITVEAAAAARWGGRTVAIPAPREVDAVMRRVPAGKVTTINEVRATLARRHRAEAACPITTGIFSWIAAHAAEEAAAAGEKDTTPYWRTLKAQGELNSKYPGGIPSVTAHLQAEGHRVVQKGTRFFVREFEHALVKI